MPPIVVKKSGEGEVLNMRLIESVGPPSKSTAAFFDSEEFKKAAEACNQKMKDDAVGLRKYLKPGSPLREAPQNRFVTRGERSDRLDNLNAPGRPQAQGRIR